MSGALETCSRPNVLRTADFTQIPTLSSLKSWPSFQQPSFSGNFSLPRFKERFQVTSRIAWYMPLLTPSDKDLYDK